MKNNNNVRAAVVFVLGVLAVAVLLDLGLTIAFGAALLVGAAALVAVFAGVEVHGRLAAGRQTEVAPPLANDRIV